MLQPDQYQRAKALFAEAVDLPPAERAAYLTKACDDSKLRAEVELLLALGDADRTGLSLGAASIHGPSPEQIGPYRIVDLLGEGGMGTVYLAEQVEPVRRRVALKVIKRGMDSRDVIARFEAERQALANLDHPQIAKVLDAGTTDDGRPYFAMEYVAGVRLTEHCDQEQLSVEERLQLFILVCEAVQHAHQKGIIHRDLKPSNVLVASVDGKAVPKIIDFGIAKAVSRTPEEATFFTQQGQFIGTPAYMSPEQADTSSRDIDTRSDIYSLGVLLYELLTGALPFERDRLHRAGYEEMMRIIRHEEPAKPSTRIGAKTGTVSESTTIASRNRRTDPRSLCRLVRGDLDWITMKCLEKERDRRYPTAQDLAEDIRRHLTNLPIIAGPPSALYRARKALRRNRGLVAAGAAVAFTLVAGATVATIYAIGEHRARAEATRQAGIADEVRRWVERVLILPPPRILEEAPAAESHRPTESIVAGIDRFSLVGYLSAMFEPRWNPYETEVIKDMLSRAASALESERVSAETLARMHIVIGKAYYEVGAFEDARKYLESGRQRTLEVVGRRHEWYADTLDYLALLAIREKHLEAGAEALDESLPLRTELLGPAHPSVAETWMLVGALRARQKRFAEATDCFRTALSIFEPFFGRRSVPVAECLHNLGLVAVRAEDPNGAESAFRESLAILEEVAGPLDTRAALVRRNLGITLRKAGRLDDALALFDAEAAHVVRIRGEGPDLALALNSRAMTLYDAGNAVAAEPILRECEAMIARTAPGHPASTTVFNNLGFALSKHQRWDEAASYFRQAVDGYSRNLGPNHRTTITKMHRLADALSQAGQIAESEAVYRECLQRARDSLEPDVWERLVIAQNFAWFFHVQGRPKDAAEFMAEYIAGRRVRGNQQSAEFADELNSLAVWQYRAGSFADAERTFREALELRRSLATSDPVGPSGPLNLLGMTLIDLGRPAEAEPFLREAVEIRRKQLPAGDVGIASSEALLGSCLVELGDWNGAAALLPPAMAVLEKLDKNQLKDTRDFAGPRLERLRKAQGTP